jgi:NAD(P)-dependent dehydrogenase (short-subunit alcohol dehydrogenase family)
LQVFAIPRTRVPVRRRVNTTELLVLLFAVALANRLARTSITANAAHPGSCAPR